VIWPHTVTVYPSQSTTDTDGNPVRRPAGAGVSVAAYVQPAAADDQAPGAPGATYRVWLADECPPLDRSAALDWDGARYELVGGFVRVNGAQMCATSGPGLSGFP
jgi:hypothetical protein